MDLGGLDLERIRRLGRWGLWVLGLVLVLSALGWAGGFYADWLWFRELGYESVLLEIVTTRVFLFLAAFVVFLLVALPNLYTGVRYAGRPRLPTSPLEPFEYDTARTLIVRAALALLVGVGLLLALGPTSEWETVLLALNAVPFGEADPVFGRDFSFFVFTLPALRLAHAWLLTAVVIVGLILLAFYYLVERFRGEPELFGRDVRRRLAVMGAMIFLLIAAGHWLGRYELLFSATGTVFGVGYTDAHVNLPGRTFLAVVALVTAGCVFYGATWGRGYGWIAWPVAGWAALVFLVGTVAPGLVQRLRVEPSELALEREYLAENIEYTRKGFGLDGLQARSHPAGGEIDAATIEDNRATIRNIRLWDEGPLLQSYNQIQFFRLYYDLSLIHI